MQKKLNLISVNPALGEQEEGQIAKGCQYSSKCDNESCFCDVIEAEDDEADAWDAVTADYPPPHEDWWNDMLSLGGEG